jgi:hypothetical protein
MSVASVKTAPQKAEHSEILDVLGPRIQFLTALSDDDGAYCLIRGVVPAGVVVPLQSITSGRHFMFLEERSRDFGRLAGASWALAMSAMCLVVSSTLGEMYPARPPHCCW